MELVPNVPDNLEITISHRDVLVSAVRFYLI
jgi:hypothetical protein